MDVFNDSIVLVLSNKRFVVCYFKVLPLSSYLSCLGHSMKYAYMHCLFFPPAVTTGQGSMMVKV